MSSDEESISDGEEVEEVDQSLSNPDVFQKYRLAGASVTEAMAKLTAECTEGKKIIDLVILGDKLLTEELSKHYKRDKKMEKGVAFPTSISPNNTIGHFCPEAGDKTILNNGDLVKIDMSGHIDGFMAVAAHTFVVGASKDEPTTGKAADLICAINLAADAILKNIKIGSTNLDVTNIIKSIGESFHVTPMEGVLSHQMKRFVIDGQRTVINKITNDQNVEEIKFEEDDVFGFDIVYSTGEGKSREGDAKPFIFKRVVDQTYLLKMKTSRQVYSEVNKKFPALAFPIRSLEVKHPRFGLSELEKHGLIHAYPVLYEKKGELVAQLKLTVLFTTTGLHRITNQPIPYVQSQYSVAPEAPEKKEGEAETAEKTKKSKKKKNKNKKAKVSTDEVPSLDAQVPIPTTTTTTTTTTEPQAEPMDTS